MTYITLTDKNTGFKVRTNMALVNCYFSDTHPDGTPITQIVWTVGSIPKNSMHALETTEQIDRMLNPTAGI